MLTVRHAGTLQPPEGADYRNCYPDRAGRRAFSAAAATQAGPMVSPTRWYKPPLQADELLAARAPVAAIPARRAVRASPLPSPVRQIGALPQGRHAGNASTQLMTKSGTAGCQGENRGDHGRTAWGAGGEVTDGFADRASNRCGSLRVAPSATPGGREDDGTCAPAADAHRRLRLLARRATLPPRQHPRPRVRHARPRRATPCGRDARDPRLGSGRGSRRSLSRHALPVAPGRQKRAREVDGDGRDGRSSLDGKVASACLERQGRAGCRGGASGQHDQGAGLEPGREGG